MNKIDIEAVFENKDFIVVHKPPQISVHDTDGEPGFLNLARVQLQIPELQLVHRLDKVTSGLLILAKSAKATTDLNKLFEEKSIQKYYIALSHYKPTKKQGTTKGGLEKSRRSGWKLTRSQSNYSVTQFFSQSVRDQLRLFILRPITGKTHQLRVVLKSLGSPIIGDPIYNAQESADRTYLHCLALAFNWNNQEVLVHALPKCGELFLDQEIMQTIEKLKPWQLNWPKSNS